MKLTPWIDGSIKPVHIGVYERNHQRPTYQFWNGKFWCLCSPTIKNAYDEPNWKSFLQQQAGWRGIAEKP